MRVLAGAAYAVGLLVFAALVGCFAFGGSVILFPEAMLPYTLREQAFFALAVGGAPLALATVAVYKYNDMRRYPRGRVALLFAPSVLCGVCGVVLAGLLCVMLLMGVWHAVTAFAAV